MGPQTHDGAAAPGPRGQSPHRSKRSHTRTAPPAATTAPSSTGPSSLGPLPTLSLPSSPPVGVPGFFIERFRIPPFLLPIYQAAGIQYGIPWQVLAAINEIETDYGRNLNVSTAGALGWMQFMPGTWRTYGVDANADGRRDPYNPADAIFAAARYLRAAGGDRDLRSAIFSYNHADWYVSSVLMRAKLIGGMPPALVDALTGLTEGRFPVAARARYAGDEAGSSRADVRARASDASASADRTSVQIYARPGAPVVAVNDGVVTRIGDDRLGGRYVVLQDVYGNTYRYSALGSISRTYPYPRPLPVTSRAVRRELHLPAPGAHPSEPASSGRHAGTHVSRPAGLDRRHRAAQASHPAGLVASSADVRPAAQPTAQPTAQPRLAAPTKERLFAHPTRPGALAVGGLRQLGDTPVTGAASSYDRSLLRLKADQVVMRRLTRGSHVIAGTVLGRVGRPAGSSSTATVADPTAPRGFDPIEFEIRPAGPKAPRIDPKPILDGWRLLASTAIYGPSGNSALTGTRRGGLSIGQILLMDKSALARRVLSDSAIKIYDCGRRDIRSGQIDRRVLATLEYLVANGLDPTVSALKCGHSYLTTSGNVSEHSSGDAVDIAAINGTPIAGHQGAGSITERTIRRLLMLQGNMKPHQIISLMMFAGADNTLALPDHADHIHVGFRPAFGPNQRLGRELDAVLKPGQWTRLMQRLDEIQNPVVPLKPSRYALPDGKGNGD